MELRKNLRRPSAMLGALWAKTAGSVAKKRVAVRFRALLRALGVV